MDKADIHKIWKEAHAPFGGDRDVEKLISNLTIEQCQQFLRSIVVRKRIYCGSSSEKQSLRFDIQEIGFFVAYFLGIDYFCVTQSVLMAMCEKLKSIGFVVNQTENTVWSILPPPKCGSLRYHWEHKDLLIQGIGESSSSYSQKEFFRWTRTLAREYFKTGEKLAKLYNGSISPAYLDKDVVVYTYAATRPGKPYPPTTLRWRRLP